ncbi:hypothetical protein, partial [Streptomyces minutiscleroticus]
MTHTQRRSNGLRPMTASTRRLAAALAAAGSLTALASCSGDMDTDAVPSKTSSNTAASSPAPSATADPEHEAVLAAYTRSWEEQTKAYAQASSDGTDLKQYTSLKALALVESDLSAMRRAGQIATGKPMIHPKVAKVSDAKIPKATVSDCVDSTKWTLIDKDSRKKVPLPTERLTKYVSTATLEQWGSKWMVTQLTA